LLAAPSDPSTEGAGCRQLYPGTPCSTNRPTGHTSDTSAWLPRRGVHPMKTPT